MPSNSLPFPRSWGGAAASTQGDNVALGISLVVGSTIFLSASDAASKGLAASLSGIEIAWLRYAGFLAIMLLAAAFSNQPRFPRSRRPGLQIVRGFGLVGSAVLFIMSLRYLPVAESTAIGFIGPIFVTALSIPFLGETVGIRRWAAAVVGLMGVLVILRPGSGAFQPASLLPMASALFWAGGLVATRKIGRSDSPRTTMTYAACVGFAVLTLAVPFVWATPSWSEVLVGAGIGLVSTIGHWIVTAAYRHAGASVLVPFSYTQIIWATLFGFVFFGATPDVWTVMGAAIVIASGLYTAHRERVRGQAESLARTAVTPA